MENECTRSRTGNVTFGRLRVENDGLRVADVVWRRERDETKGLPLGRICAWRTMDS